IGDGALQQCVAVVRRVRDEIGGDVAAGPAAVLDDELLTEQPRERLCEHACRDVAGGAGAEADDDACRPRRIVFRFGNLCDCRKRGSAHGQLQKTATGERHGGSSLNEPCHSFCRECWTPNREEETVCCPLGPAKSRWKRTRRRLIEDQSLKNWWSQGESNPDLLNAIYKRKGNYNGVLIFFISRLYNLFDIDYVNR